MSTGMSTGVTSRVLLPVYQGGKLQLRVGDKLPFLVRAEFGDLTLRLAYSGLLVLVFDFVKYLISRNLHNCAVKARSNRDIGSHFSCQISSFIYRGVTAQLCSLREIKDFPFHWGVLVPLKGLVLPYRRKVSGFSL